MQGLHFEIFSKGHSAAVLGESPCWDREADEIWWVDIAGRRLLKTLLSSGETLTWDMPEQPGFVVMRGRGRPVVGMETGIYEFNTKSLEIECLINFNQPGCRFNDAAVDQAGRLWVSSIDLDARAGRGEIYLVETDLRLKTVFSGLTIPNGMAIDPDRKRLFLSDSHVTKQDIWCVGIAGGSGDFAAKPDFTDPERFSDLSSLPGRPDGAALDQEGNYWIAGVDGGELYVFAPDGNLTHTVEVPFPAPTKLCFCGADNRTLVVTSKNEKGAGGFLARAVLPGNTAPGRASPYWASGN